MKIGRIIGFGIAVIVILGVVFWAVGLSNTYNKKYVAGKAVQQQSYVIFDNTWKKIKGQAGVTTEYKEGFKEIYVELMDARYKNDAGAGQQTLMKWVTESNPEFDSGLYKTLMNTIEGSRNEFTMQQQKLIDIDRELKSMKVTFPNNLVLKNKADLEIELVTSSKTKHSFSTGEENEGVNPFD